LAKTIDAILSDQDLKEFAQNMAKEINADVFLLPYGSDEYGNFGTPCWVIDSRRELVMFREIREDGWSELKSLGVQFVSYTVAQKNAPSEES
jgi:hypothetical protein